MELYIQLKNSFERGTIIISARGSIGYPRLPDLSKYFRPKQPSPFNQTPKAPARKLHVWLQTIDNEILTSTVAPMLTVADIDDVFVPVIDLET